MNTTIEKFGYPHTLLHEYDYWCVLLRPQQITLGSLILAARSEAVAFSELSQFALTELSIVSKDIESTLHTCFQYNKLNYLMLMMVDPHVHLHVIPRYETERIFTGLTFVDQDWPKPPDLSRSCFENVEQYNNLQSFLVQKWRNSSNKLL